jgi:uncharacterized damage-inducible protein DinB
MQTIEELRNLLNYNEWANLRTIASLRASPNAPLNATRAFTHLLIAERIWLMRLQNNLDTTGFEFWPAVSLAECEAMAHENAQSYTEMVAALTDDQLDSIATYKNSKGVEYETTYRDILTHVMMHSAYHRGQVAMAVRVEGGKPAYTDYIAYVREKR